MSVASCSLRYRWRANTNDESFSGIPLIGRYVNAFINAMWYVQVSYERVAEFMADDFNLGAESALVGRKVAPHQVRW